LLPISFIHPNRRPAFHCLHQQHIHAPPRLPIPRPPQHVPQILARRPISPAFNLLIHPLLQFLRQRHVHGATHIPTSYNQKTPAAICDTKRAIPSWRPSRPSRLRGSPSPLTPP